MSTHYGVIIFSKEVTSKSFTDVVAAAATAGIDPEWVHAVKPRNAFIRAVRGLKKEGAVVDRADGILTHKYQDDSNSVKFQFSQTYLRAAGVEYDKAAVISFNKDSHLITCDNSRILAVAERLYETVQRQLTCTDIQALVKRVVEKNDAKRLPLRDGVYFLPASKARVAEQIKLFFEELGLSFYVLPVNAQSGERVNLIKAAIDDMKTSVASFQTEIRNLKGEGKLTQRVARARLKELHTELKQYREIAAALQEDAGSLIEAAGVAGKSLAQTGDGVEALISKVQGGSNCTGLIYDLVEAAEPEFKMPSRSFIVTEQQEETAQQANVERQGAVLADIG
jgi:hypothetical protein